MPEPVLLHVQYRFCGARMLQPEFYVPFYRFWGIVRRFSKIGNEPIPVLESTQLDGLMATLVTQRQAFYRSTPTRASLSILVTAALVLPSR